MKVIPWINPVGGLGDTLMLSGVLTPREALTGFGDPVVLLVAGLIDLGEALNRTGVSYAI